MAVARRILHAHGTVKDGDGEDRVPLAGGSELRKDFAVGQHGAVVTQVQQGGDTEDGAGETPLLEVEEGSRWFTAGSLPVGLADGLEPASTFSSESHVGDGRALARHDRVLRHGPGLNDLDPSAGSDAQHDQAARPGIARV